MVMEPQTDVRKLLELPGPARLVGTERQAADMQAAELLWPREWDEYIGHDREKLVVGRLLDAAEKRGSLADHILLHGPPGLGKTAMAHLIQDRLGSHTRMLSSLSTTQSRAILVSLRPRAALFIDEIHSLKPSTMETVQIAMEGGVVGWQEKAPPFTLLAATTKWGDLPLTLRDRFGLVLHLRYYSEAETARIARQSAEKLNMELRPKSADTIAARARGVPRIANRLLRRVQDVYDNPTPRQVSSILLDLGVDSWGMDDGDRDLLMLLYRRFNGGPVGVRTLAAAAGLDATTVSDAFEPYWLRQQIVDVQPRGRELTEHGYAYCQEVMRFLAE